jgi:hypothetical protein
MTLAKTGFDTLRTALGLVKDVQQALPSGEKKEVAARTLEEADKQLRLAEAEIAKALGYTLCRCEFPPTPMLQVSYMPPSDDFFEQSALLIMAKDGHASAPSCRISASGRLNAPRLAASPLHAVKGKSATCSRSAERDPSPPEQAGTAPARRHCLSVPILRAGRNAVKPGPAGPRLRRLRASRRLARRSLFHHQINALLSVELSSSLPSADCDISIGEKL